MAENIVGGANGTGKTTYAVAYAAERNCLYLGADAIAAELAPDAPQFVPVSTGQELLRRMTVALADEQAVVLESTLAGRTVRHTMEHARQVGFAITIVYLCLDSPDLCVQRVHERVQKGGHFVPESDIRRRYTRSLRNFWRFYRPLADEWLLIDNSGNRLSDVAMGTADEVAVRDAELFASFLIGGLQSETQSGL